MEEDYDYNETTLGEDDQGIEDEMDAEREGDEIYDFGIEDEREMLQQEEGKITCTKKEKCQFTCLFFFHTL